jgi:hypothetical protein
MITQLEMETSTDMKHLIGLKKIIHLWLSHLSIETISLILKVLLLGEMEIIQIKDLLKFETQIVGSQHLGLWFQCLQELRL